MVMYIDHIVNHIVGKCSTKSIFIVPSDIVTHGPLC